MHSPAAQIEAAVRAALGTHGFDEILTVASVDTKAHEAGLLEFCAHHALPLAFFSREQLAAVPVDEPSAAAREHLGVDGVCEPCALLAAGAAAAAAMEPAVHHETASAASANSPDTTDKPTPPRARLLVRKTIHAGVTVAIATTSTSAARPRAHHNSLEQDL
jgi:cobalamin biosynthesis protein CbiG